MIYRFADIQIDSEQFELHRAGKLVAIEPQVFDLLLHLVQHSEQVLSRDELIAKVWKGRIVSDATVASAIKFARRALGDNGHTQKFIKTLHGRGFRLMVTPEVTTEEVIEEKFSQAQTRIPASETLRPATDPEPSTKAVVTDNKPPPLPSIILLPLRHGEGKELASYLDALTTQLETYLFRVPLLQISSQGSYYSSTELPPTARQLHEELGVSYVLEGNAQRMADNIKLNLQLSDASSGFRLWAGQFNQPYYQQCDTDELATNIIAKLEPQVTKAIYQATQKERDNTSVYGLYFKASGLLAVKGWHQETFLQAADMLRKCVDLAPDFALAPAYLSLVLALGHRVGLLTEREQTKEEALKMAEYAMTLDNTDSAVLGFAGCALADIGFPERARHILGNALDQNSANAQAWAALGSVLLMDHQIEEAVDHLQHSIRISPLDNRLSIWGAILALALIANKDLHGAKEQAQLACQRDDRTYLPRVVLAATCWLEQDKKQATAALQDALRIRPDLAAGEVCHILGKKLGNPVAELLNKLVGQ